MLNLKTHKPDGFSLTANASNSQKKYLEQYAEYNSLCLLLPESYLSLPFTDFNAIQSGIAAYLLSLNILEDAIKNFIRHEYRKFDALIGNNSCYLVAYIIFILASRIEKDEYFHDKCINILKDVKELKASISKHCHQIDEKISKLKKLNLFDFLIENNLVINCDVNFIYLALSFGCTLSKEKNIYEFEEINYDRLLEKYKYSIQFELKKKSVIKLVKHWQKIISYINVKTIQEHSKFIPKIEQQWSKYIHDPHILKDGRGRLCTSSLYAQRVIYNLLLTIPNALIGLQVNIVENNKNFLNRFTLYYEVQEKGILKLLSKDKVQPHRPIYMFAGCRYVSQDDSANRNLEDIEKSFTSRILRDLIFAHEVTYPQYPQSLNASNISPQEYPIIREITRLKEFKGFSLEDPSDICLVHIFTDHTLAQLSSFKEPPVFLPNIL